jgi:hypothetical protein
MSKIAVSPNGSGTGTYTLASPNNNASHTLTLPVATGELLTTTGDGSGLTGVDSFKPVAVSGATQALNVGSYNFFNAGSLTANTTVSFTSVPTNARWSYSFVPSFISPDPWDVTEAVYFQSFSSGVGAAPSDIFFKPDGTEMYVVDYGADDVKQFSLSTAWNISTAVYQRALDVSSRETSPYGLFFKSDGTKMYVCGSSSESVNEYSLSTAWDISTASYTHNFFVGSPQTKPTCLSFKDDGNKMYVSGGTNTVIEYNLSTAWNVSTASSSQSFDVSSQENDTVEGMAFKADGTKMYIIGATDAVYEYNLSTAWDVSSASYLQSINVSSNDTDNQGIYFKPDGTKMYLAGNSGNEIDEYNLGPISTLTLPASVSGNAATLAPTKRTTYEFFTTDGGTTVHLIGEEVI